MNEINPAVAGMIDDGKIAIEEQHSLMGNGARPLTYPLSRTTVAPKPYLR